MNKTFYGHTPNENSVGECSNFKKFLRTRKIMVMHSNERGECDLRTLVDRQWKRNCPKYFPDKKDGKVNKGIFDIHIIDVYLTNARCSAWVFDTSPVAKIGNSKREL